jgi:hypothetical protein
MSGFRLRRIAHCSSLIALVSQCQYAALQPPSFELFKQAALLALVTALDEHVINLAHVLLPPRPAVGGWLSGIEGRHVAEMQVKIQNTKVKSDKGALARASAILTSSDLYFAF